MNGLPQDSPKADACWILTLGSCSLLVSLLIPGGCIGLRLPDASFTFAAVLQPWLRRMPHATCHTTSTTSSWVCWLFVCFAAYLFQTSLHLAPTPDSDSANAKFKRNALQMRNSQRNLAEFTPKWFPARKRKPMTAAANVDVDAKAAVSVGVANFCPNLFMFWSRSSRKGLRKHCLI